MKIKKIISTLLNIVFVMTILFFIFDALTEFEIKNQTIKSSIYYGLLILTPIVFIWNVLTFKTKKKRIISLILPILTLIGILIIGPIKIISSSPAWRTQTVLYQNGHSNFKKVEFQMQDVGAFGYNKRTVEVTYLTDLFMFVKSVDRNIDKSVEWVRVDKDINELGLKHP
ncbi:MAG: hypothetical protein ABFS35_21855 [Bacteroidota bacterium]